MPSLLNTAHIHIAPFRSLALVILLLLTPCAALAQTHFTDPHAGLAVHGAGAPAELAQTAAQLYKTANDDIGKWMEQGQNNKIDAAKPAEVGKLYVQLQQIGRAGRRLSDFGEPAGPDYVARQVLLNVTYSQLLAAYKNFPVAQAYTNVCREQLARGARQRERTLESIQKLAQAKKFLEAEAELDKALDALDQLAVFMPPEELPPITGPFHQIQGVIQSEARRIRVENAQAHLVAARDAVKAEGAASVESLTAAAQSLSTSAAVEVDGQSLSGPALVALLDKTLTAEHAAALRRRAIEMARYSALGQPTAAPEVKAIEDQYAALHKQLIALLPAIISAEASRAAETEAVALYPQHLTAAARLLLKVDSQPLKEETRKALAALAARSPALAAQAAAEEAACREPLRWRQRAAAAQAKAKAQEFPPIAKFFPEATTVDTMNFSDIAPQKLAEGFFYPNSGNEPHCMFWGATPRIVAATQPRLAGKGVAVGPLFPLENGAGVSRYTARTIAMLPLTDFSAAATELQNSLLGEGNTPLSLDVAIAVEGTRLGWLRSAGGVIDDMFVEAVLTRFAKTPEAIAHLTPLGTLNDEPKESLIRHALARFMLKPAWYQGDYFFLAAE